MLFLLRPPATAFAPPQTVWFLSSTQRQACAETEPVPVTIFHVLLERSPKSHTSAEGLCKEPHPGSMHPTPPPAARGWRPDRHTDAGLPGTQGGAESLSRPPTGVCMRRGIAKAERPALSMVLPLVRGNLSFLLCSVCCSNLILVWKLQIVC